MSHKECFLFKETDAQFPTIQKREVTAVSTHTKYRTLGVLHWKALMLTAFSSNNPCPF